MRAKQRSQPARGARRAVAVGEGVREDERAAVAVGPQLEAQLVAEPAADEQARRVALGDVERSVGRKPLRELVGLADRAPDALDRRAIAALEAQQRAVLERRVAEAHARDHAATGRGILIEADGVALVQLADRTVRGLLREVAAGELRGEPLEVGLPAGRVLRGRPVPRVEDVSEDEHAAVAVGPQLEAIALVGPAPGEQQRLLERGDLAALTFALEGLPERRRPRHRRDEPALELGRLRDGAPDALHRVRQAALEAQRRAPVDGLQRPVDHGFSSRCRSSASSRSDQYAR